MPAYVYRCQDCGDEIEERHPIGTAKRLMGCPTCGGLARQVLGVGLGIAAEALPNKRHDVRRIEGTERRWSSDMDAYKTLRRQGLSPQKIDGAHDLGMRAEERFEIEMGRTVPKSKRGQFKETLASIEPHPAIVSEA